jgi:outer membrane protein OmpA-like peptidoglycan-associated protein
MRLALLAAASLAAGCATAPQNAPAPPAAAVPPEEEPRTASLERARCVIVAPFENASDAPLAGDAATGAVVAAVDPSRARVMPVPELRQLFRDTAFELPQGMGPTLALELAELLGADAAIYGAVEGRSRPPGGPLVVTVRVATTERELLLARTTYVRPAQGESVEKAVRRTVEGAVRPTLAALGAPGKKTCFDRERQARLRALALADARASQSARVPQAATSTAATPAAAAAPAVAAPVPAAAPASPRGAAPAPAQRPAPTPRQGEWSRRLAERGRFAIDDLEFRGRTAKLARDAGLADLAAALAVAPDVKVRLEGFVDATSDPRMDARLSMSMAQAAGKRLVALGIARDRVTWAGRGGETPLLPNFTARGRAANRRVEAVGLR